MSLLRTLRQIVDKDIAAWAARQAKIMGHSKERAIREATTWQRKRDSGYRVSATERGINASKAEDPETRHLWENIT